MVAPSDGTDVRLNKLCHAMLRLGHNVHFIGWDRQPDQPKQLHLGDTHIHIMVRATVHGRWNMVGHLAYVRYVSHLCRKIRPDLAWVVNEELALSLLPLRYFLCRYLVCDIFDSLADRHSQRGSLIVGLLRLGTIAARAGSDRLIVTDEARKARLGRFRYKAVVIGNYPEDPGPELSKSLPVGPVHLWVAGSLMGSRGLETALAVIDDCENVDIQSAGWIYDSIAAEKFLKHPRVHFHGILSPAESLAAAAACDAVFAFYAPVSVNNRLASPNKIYDALSIGRPIIINEEVAVSKFVTDQNMGYTCKYDDVESLKRIVLALKAQRSNLPEFADRARALLKKGYTWAAMTQRIATVIEDLED